MRWLAIMGVLFFSFPSLANSVTKDALYRGKDLAVVTPAMVASTVTPGTVVIVSELHDFLPHHLKQVEMLNALGAQGLKISVGMEFFSYPDQAIVDSYLAGQMDEPTFLKQIGWGGNDYNQYRQQVLFPTLHAGTTIALNAPRMLTGKIARKGLAGLTQEDWTLMPPNFQLGRDEYKERFKEVMDGHLPNPELFENYFAAQSTWDETMAWTATKFLAEYPDQVLFIIVGDFHNEYYGGLPDRLKARGINKIVTISQVDLAGLTEEEGLATVAPHPRWGVRADFVWTSQSEQSDRR